MEILRQENKNFKLEAREKLLAVENSIKVCTTSKANLESGYQNIFDHIGREFQEIYSQIKKKEMRLKEEVQRIFGQKILEYETAIKDLTYLKTCMKEYKDYTQGGGGGGEGQQPNFTVYIFSVYQIIRKTLQKVEFNFRQVQPEEIATLIDFNKGKNFLL